MTWPVVCATGHREVVNGAEPWVRAELGRCAAWLREHGTRTAISGMARGVDVWWADAALTAGLDLWAAIPFEGQAARWPAATRREWERILALAARVRIVGEVPADTPPKKRSGLVNGLLHQRNDVMLDRAAAVVAVWERGKLDVRYFVAVTPRRFQHEPGA